MSRVIKFRAWDIVNNKMLNWESILCLPFGIQTVLFSRKDDYIPMQFTGLHDKNGKEIYEGDVISVKGHSYEDTFNGIVTYKLGGFWLDRDYLGNWKEYMLEVIGNVYENPELIKEQL